MLHTLSRKDATLAFPVKFEVKCQKFKKNLNSSLVHFQFPVKWKRTALFNSSLGCTAHSTCRDVVEAKLMRTFILQNESLRPANGGFGVLYFLDESDTNLPPERWRDWMAWAETTERYTDFGIRYTSRLPQANQCAKQNNQNVLSLSTRSRMHGPSQPESDQRQHVVLCLFLSNFLLWLLENLFFYCAWYFVTSIVQEGKVEDELL